MFNMNKTMLTVKQFSSGLNLPTCIHTIKICNSSNLFKQYNNIYYSIIISMYVYTRYYYTA